MLTTHHRLRRLGAAVAVNAVAIAGGATVLAANPAADQPAGRCPSGYEPMTVRQVLRIATEGFEDAIRQADVNGDRILCVLLLPEAIPLFEPTFLYYDNDRVP
jgi:hypothetical protein